MSTDLMKAISEEKAVAEVFTVTTPDAYQGAAERLKGIKGLLKRIDETFNPIIAAAKGAWDKAREQRDMHTKPLHAAEAILKTKMLAYQELEEIKRKEEEAAAQAELKKLKEAEALETAAALEAVGEGEAAATVVEEAVQYIPPPIVLPKETPKVAGISTRELWSAQVTDLMKLVKAVASGQAPIQAIQANQVFLNAQARLLKNTLNYPGVSVTSKPSMSAGVR